MEVIELITVLLQFRLVHKSLDETHFLAIAVRKRLDFHIKVIIEPSGQFPHVIPVDTAAKVTHVFQQLPAGQVIIGCQLAREVADAPPSFQAVPGDIQAEDSRTAAGGKKEMELKEFIENVNKKDEKRNGLKIRFAFVNRKR